MSHLWSMVQISCTQHVQPPLLDLCGVGGTEEEVMKTVWSFGIQEDSPSSQLIAPSLEEAKAPPGSTKCLLFPNPSAGVSCAGGRPCWGVTVLASACSCGCLSLFHQLHSA